MTAYVSGTNQTAAEQPHFEQILFVDLDLPSGHIRAHTRTGTVTWGGNDYLGVGKLGAISDISEDSMLRPNGVTLQISGVDSALVTSAITEAYHGRPVSVYEGYLNVSTLVLLATPETKFRGLADVMTINLGENSAAIVVQCEGELARWDRHQGLLFTHESQQTIFPGDLGFNQIPLIQNRTINWIKKSNWGSFFNFVRVAKTNKWKPPG